VFGDEADPNSLYAFVHIKDVDTGAEVTALRGIPKNYNLKGVEKGNTLLNQVCIWSERLALERQYPGEMPPGVEVVDERYEDVPDVGKVDKATGEITEGEFTEVEEEAAKIKDGLDYMAEHMEHWCREHNCPYELKKSRYGDFYAHKIEGGWCNEKKKKEKGNASKPEPEAKYNPVTTDMPDAAAEQAFTPPDEPQEPSPNTVDDLRETMQLCNWSALRVGTFCNAEKGWNIREFKDLTPEQIAEVIDHIKRNAK